MKTVYLAFLLLLLLFAGDAASGQGEDWADVVRVEPIVKSQQVSPADPACQDQRPRRIAGLVELLRWDLVPDCQFQERRITSHYRVFYTWGGREFNYISQTLPNSKVRVRLEIEPF